VGGVVGLREKTEQAWALAHSPAGCSGLRGFSVRGGIVAFDMTCRRFKACRLVMSGAGARFDRAEDLVAVWPSLNVHHAGAGVACRAGAWFVGGVPESEWAARRQRQAVRHLRSSLLGGESLTPSSRGTAVPWPARPAGRRKWAPHPLSDVRAPAHGIGSVVVRCDASCQRTPRRSCWFVSSRDCCVGVRSWSF